jgi:ubiquinone/menaquinone biosynthesis C-methylase UbiE
MKSQLSIVEKRAVSSKKLQNRINLNKKLGSKDLTEWLFQRYKIKKNDSILELGCGVGNHILKEIKIIKKNGFILATDYSNKSLNVLKKNLKTKNVKTKCISMDDIPKFLKNKKIYFDKIISSYALYYAKNPIKVITECSKFLKPKGFFLITAPCYPHTLTRFASTQKTLPAIAKKYIDFSTKKLEPFLKKKKIHYHNYNFQNKLKFKNIEDLLYFYRSTIFYNQKSEKNLINLFKKEKNKYNHYRIIKSAKLYKFSIKIK